MVKVNKFQQVSDPEFEVPIHDVSNNLKCHGFCVFFIMMYVDLSGRDKLDVIVPYMKVVEVLGSSPVSYIVSRSP